MTTEKAYVPIFESCIIGLVSGASAVALSYGVNWLGALRVHLSDQFPSYYVLPLFGLTGGLVAGLLVEKIAPEASGSGIPQVRARLDRILMALDLRIAFVKLLGGMIALGSGFFLGREGPTVQLGAALAAPLARWLPTTAEHKRQLIAAGAGAGLTAAFNAPLAGVTFVLEELLKETKPSTVMIAVVACSAACLVLNILAPPHIRAAMEPISSSITFAPKDIPFYLLLALLSGLVGAVFNSAIIGALNINQTVLRMPVSLRVALAGLVSGIIISILPESFHNYAAMRGLIIAGESNWQMVGVAFLEYYLLTLIAYGSGAPGGLFAPSLVLGSSLGYLVGCVEQAATGSGSPATFALVGMGAFFAAVARTPLTAIVITFELTTSFVLLTPLMMACVLASAMAEFASKGGLYDHLMHWNGIHLKGPGSIEVLQILKAKDVMHSGVTAFSSKLLVKDILPVFGTSNQRGFPIVDKGKLVGVITQTDFNKINQLELSDALTLADIMSQHPVAVSPHDTLEEILFLFSHYKFTWLPVTSQDKLAGIILQSDVIEALFMQEKQLYLAESYTAENTNGEKLQQQERAEVSNESELQQQRAEVSNESGH